MFNKYLKLWYHVSKTNCEMHGLFFKSISSLSSLRTTVAEPHLAPAVTKHEILRYKSKSSKKKPERESTTSSNDSEDLGNEVQDKHTKILKINVTSLRVDGILKSGLGLARNKIETQFYESKIRVNGEKILKKSATVKEGDEIDLIKGPDVKNPNFLNIARVEILSVKPDEESISVKIRRCKSLVIEAYAE